MATALPDDSGLKHYTAKSLKHWTGPTKKPTGLKGFAAIVPEPDSRNKSSIYAATCQKFSAGKRGSSHNNMQVVLILRLIGMCLGSVEVERIQ